MTRPFQPLLLLLGAILLLAPAASARLKATCGLRGEGCASWRAIPVASPTGMSSSSATDGLSTAILVQHVRSTREMETRYG